MSNTIGKNIAAVAALIASIVFAPAAYPQEEIEYKKFKLEDASCDVGVRYKKTPKGLILGVSAVATGKGAEFRKWGVSSIKLRIGNDRIRPDHYGNFYVKDESFFRVPGAILIAVISGLGEYGGSNFNNTMSKIGVSLGLGLLALTANGEITGERCVFYIPTEVEQSIEEGKDKIEIVINNEGQHIEKTITIGIIRPSVDTEKTYNFDKMSEDEVLNRMDSLKSSIIALEQEQSGYKYGEDPQYDSIERKIEALETERGLAYKAWYEKRNGPDGLQ